MSAFIREAWPTIEPATEFIPGWHIDAIAEHLEAVTAGEILRLLINIPPRSMKSISVSIMWPAWEWTFRPWLRWMFASYSSPLAIDHSISRRTVITSEWYQSRWSDVYELTADGVESLRNNHRGAMEATSFSGTATGKGANRLVIDDPHNTKQAESDIERKNTVRDFDRTFSTRLNDKKRDAIVVVMQRLHECLLPQSCIMTGMSTIQAKDIKTGDPVLTSQGVQHVVAVAKREHSGTAVAIRTFGWHEPLRVTPAHPILTTHGWKTAGDLTTNDTLLFPIPQGETSQEELRTLWPVLPERQSPKLLHTVTGARGRVPKDVLQRLVDEGKSSREIAAYFGFKHRQMADVYIAAFGIVKPLYRRVESSILEDADFWRVVGWWLAEGDLTRGRNGHYSNVRFTLGADEQEEADDIKAVMARYGVPVTVKPGVSVLSLFFGARQIAGFLEKFGVGARNKSLPDWAVRLPEAFLRQLVIGYWKGDGSLTADGQARVTSASLGLVHGLQRALLRLGVIASVVASRGEKNSSIKTGKRSGHIVRSGASYEVRWRPDETAWLGAPVRNPARWRANQIDGDWLRVRIKGLEVEEYTGTVYDIETPCHDFVSGLITAHNCDVSARCIEQGYVHLCLPAEAEGRTVVLFPRSGREIFREDGELLWPDREGKVEIQRARLALGDYGYAGQYQQRPAPEAGGMFPQTWPIVDTAPAGGSRVRFWDKAGTAGGGAYTCGVLMARHADGRYVILDVIRGQWSASTREQTIKQAAQSDGRDVRVWVEQEPGSGGKESAESTIRNLAGYIVAAHRVTGDKEARARPLAAQTQGGNVSLVRAGWNKAFIDECKMFPNGRYKDQVDAASGAFNKLLPNTSSRSVVGGSRSTIKLR